MKKGFESVSDGLESGKGKKRNMIFPFRLHLHRSCDSIEFDAELLHQREMQTH